MENKVALSVIVPVYNAETTLQRCVESLCRQGLPETSYEIWLVDDGSTDGSSKLCDDLADAHPQIEVVHQSNAGVSVARNNGIEHARGEWIAFIDADDYLLDNGYATVFLPYADRQDADLIHYYSSYDFWPKKPLVQGVDYEGRTWDIIKNVGGGLPSFCWLYIYRKSFLDRFSLRFRPYIVGEDQLFSSSAFLANPYMISCTADIYRYVIVENSATTKREVPHSRKSVDDYLSSYDDILAFGKKQGADKDMALWQKCLDSINSKKMFAVSRMLSSKYNHKQYNVVRKRCIANAFYPVVDPRGGIKAKLTKAFMNAAMSGWIRYQLLAFLFNNIVATIVLPRLRKHFK